MSTPRDQKRLGRGLAALLQPSDSVAVTPPMVPIVDAPRPGRTAIQTIRCDRIRPNPFQPRSDIPPESLAELAASIKKTGMLQPITVRQVGSSFELIAGERRWRATQQAGLAEVPALLRAASDEEMLELAIIENIFREDLNAIDRARAYSRYCHEFGLSPDQVATRIGEDRSTVVNYLRLLDLPSSVQDRVKDGRLSMGHARALAGLQDRAEIERMAMLVDTNALSVRGLEELLRKQKSAPAVREPVPPPAKRAHVRDLEQQFGRALGVKVEIQEARRKGAGRIVISYASLDDFDRVAERLGIRWE